MFYFCGEAVLENEPGLLHVLGKYSSNEVYMHSTSGTIIFLYYVMYIYYRKVRKFKKIVRK